MRPPDSAADCGWFWELAAEVALGLVTGHERADVLAHLQRCSACCGHTARLGAVHDRLCSLIPSVEPPTGFEQRVLRRLGAATAPRRAETPCWARAAAAVVMVAAGFTGGWLAGTATHPPAHPATPAVASPLMAGDRHVGDVVVRVERPQFMSVYLDVAQPGRLTCQFLHSDGSLAATETYDASGGVGWWDIQRPDRYVTTIRVSDAAGDVVGAGILPRP